MYIYKDIWLFPAPGPQTPSFIPDLEEVPQALVVAAASLQSLLYQEVDEGGSGGEEGLLDASPL